MNYCGSHWSLKMITVVTTAVTLSNSASDWPEVIYTQERPTCLPLRRHISKTMGVTWVNTNKLHYTSNTRSPMYSYHHTTIIIHTIMPRQSSIQSIATVRSQFAIITHIIVSSAALRMLLAGWLCAWGCGLTRRCVSY